MSAVYALATPPAKSAICVFRVSGEGCLDQMPVLFGSPPKEHGFFCVRNISLKNEVIDKNLLRYMTIRVKKFDLEAKYFSKKDEYTGF